MEPLSEAAIRESSDDELPLLVWASLIDTALRDPQALRNGQQVVYFVELVNYEIGNGGLVQYFHNTRGAFVDQTVAALQRIGAPHHHAVFLEATRIWRAERAMLEAMWGTVEGFSRSYDLSSLSGLDDRWYDVPIEPLEAAFVRANLDEFLV